MASKGIHLEDNEEDVLEATQHQSEVSEGIATHNWFTINQHIILNNNKILPQCDVVVVFDILKGSI
jgi:hypothetical protein